MSIRNLLCPAFSASLVAALLIVGVRSSVNETECANLAASGNCSFYNVCIEAVVPCGPNGYAQGYGGKYCERFGDPEYNKLFNEKASAARGAYTNIHILYVYWRKDIFEPTWSVLFATRKRLQRVEAHAHSLRLSEIVIIRWLYFKRRRNLRVHR